MREKLNRKYKGVPLILILICILVPVTVALAQLTWNWIDNITYDTTPPEAPQEDTYTFSITDPSSYITVEITLDGSGIVDEPIDYQVLITNTHPTDTVRVTFRVRFYESGTTNLLHENSNSPWTTVILNPSDDSLTDPADDFVHSTAEDIDITVTLTNIEWNP